MSMLNYTEIVENAALCISATKLDSFFYVQPNFLVQMGRVGPQVQIFGSGTGSGLFVWPS